MQKSNCNTTHASSDWSLAGRTDVCNVSLCKMRDSTNRDNTSCLVGIHEVQGIMTLCRMITMVIRPFRSWTRRVPNDGTWSYVLTVSAGRVFSQMHADWDDKPQLVNYQTVNNIETVELCRPRSDGRAAATIRVGRVVIWKCSFCALVIGRQQSDSGRLTTRCTLSVCLSACTL